MLLLTTKFSIPPLRPVLVSRPRLISRLEQGIDGRLTLVCASAGYGKTTLLCDWVSRSGWPAAWLSLEEEDNDPVRFMAYLVAALEKSCPGLREKINQEHQGIQPLLTEKSLTILINEIARLTDGFPAAQRLMIVLDDYHLITSGAIHEGVSFLVGHLPKRVHLVIATRVDPPLPIARLRARGQITELRQEDLKFTTDEIAEFVKTIFSLHLSGEEISLLAQKTEGWAAGVQIAAASMTKQADMAGYLRSFSGSHRHLLEYMTDEIINGQTDEVKNFLLRTAHLERLCASLCDAVLGVTGSRQMLEKLEKANLFLSPLDEQHEYYRYHPLFADSLKKCLEQQIPGETAQLHCRAAEWFHHHGDYMEAIEHFLRAQDFNMAARLIAESAEAVAMRSEIATLLRWIEALPDEIISQNPTICLYHAWTLLLTGHPIDMVLKRLKQADTGAPHLSGKLNALRAFVALYQGEVGYAASALQAAMQTLSEDDVLTHGIVAWNTALSNVWSGDLDVGIQGLDKAVNICWKGGNLLLAVVARCNQAEASMTAGRLRNAWRLFQDALDMTITSQGERNPAAGMAMIGMGELLREWNDLEAANRYLSEGTVLTRRWGEIASLDGYVSMARLQLARGDRSKAQAILLEAKEIARKFDLSKWDDLLVSIYQARLWLANSELDKVSDWIDAHGLADNLTEAGFTAVQLQSSMPPYLHILAYEVLAFWLVAQKNYQQAIRLLEVIQSIAGKIMYKGLLIESYCLMAMIWFDLGHQVEAFEKLESALSLGEDEGFVRIYADLGPGMMNVLAAYRKHEPRRLRSAYLKQLLSAFLVSEQAKDGQSLMAVGEAIPGTEMIEPLSSREIEVLHWIAVGLSNQEIANRLFISISTVKTHINNLYQKLGADSRTQAVARARELRLDIFPPP